MSGQFDLLKSLGIPRELASMLDDEAARKDSILEQEVDSHVGLHWDDMRVPLTRDKQGQLQKPDYDFTNMGLLFPNGDPSEIVYITAQMSHAMLLGSDIHAHVHFVQSVAQQPTFKIAYRWYENNADPLGAFTTIAATTFAFPWTGTPILQIAVFPPIVGSAITKVSSMLDIKLFRDDVAVAGDVLAKEFDMHYQIDGHGSVQEYTK